MSQKLDRARRRLLTAAVAAGTGLGLFGRQASAQETDSLDDLHFPGDEPEHKLLYQLNKADPGYQEHVLFSVGAVLRKYGDNVKIVVVAFAEGIHVLAREPLRPVSDEIQSRVSSLAQYGVEFHACGNTLKSLEWDENDLVDFAQVVEVGAADIMELQEQGYSYISW
ncbi:DsrE family protein [Thiohalomonas denitrificans]|uniref:Uncharacterized protein n=1 Tax=Thiohalomonas denitrificans TaxID=415747 RepID=A0A1G5PK83_9GAMM|nr:DsrE family protein [Thiohalomonas denitrificans]SCZ49520.1 hypothetical protein SAMN03097708_00182 [Thiohalomonas denitrificans]